MEILKHKIVVIALMVIQLNLLVKLQEELTVPNQKLIQQSTVQINKRKLHQSFRFQITLTDLRVRTLATLMMHSSSATTLKLTLYHHFT